MIVLIIILYLMVLMVMAVKPARSKLSIFELERRAEKKNKDAEEVLRREKLLPRVLTLKRIVVVLLGLVFAGLSVQRMGILPGLVFAGFMFILTWPLSRFKSINSVVSRLYALVERQVLRFVEKFGVVFDFFKDLSSDISGMPRAASKEELEYVVSMMDEDVVSADEKTIMLATLKFSEKVVTDIMVPKSEVVYIKKDIPLTPVELDKLHKTSFSHFPVVNEDIDHVEGILKAKNILSISDKKSPKAESVMEKRVYFVRDDHSLEYALNAFVRTGAYFFVVINETRETVGVLTLRDLLESLLGKNIADEFEGDDDKTTVASRKPKNGGKNGVDL